MTYLLISIPFLTAGILLWCMCAPRYRKQALVTAVVMAVLLTLTVIFDNLMVAAGLYDFTPGTNASVYLGRIPIEDLFYPIFVVLVATSLWPRAPGELPGDNVLPGILAASRPVSWVNTAVPFALAYLLSAGRVDWLLAVGFVFFLIPYNIAMYGINDVFDYESDIRNPRKGGIEGAVLPRSMHRPLLVTSAVTVIPFAAVLYAAGTWVSAVWLTLALVAVVAYSAPPLRFKEVPVLDSVTSSAHFTLPAVVGATTTGPAPDTRFWLAMAAFYCWGMASHALGAVQDVEADREGGLRSIATAFGARTTTRLAAALYLVAAAACFFLPFPGWIVGLLGMGYVANTARYWNVTDATSTSVNSAWRVFLWLNYLTGAVVTISVLAAVAA